MQATGVAITGLGVLSCNGIGREAYWDALASGRSGIRALDRFDVSPFYCQIGGQLWDFNPSDFLPARVIKHWHRHVHQGVAASRLAVEDAGLKEAGYDEERLAASIGTSIGSPDEAYSGHMEAFKSGGYKKVSKFASSAFAGHAATVHVTIDLGLRGPAITISSGCATGLDVLAWGCNQISLGNADAAVVGATESPLFLSSFATACSLGILTRRNDEPEKAMRPFDRFRDGIALSEAACVVVLERLDKAQSRGARILGEVLGNHSAAEGYNPLILDRKGGALARAIEGALRDAGLQPRDVDHVQAHGSSIEMYDRSETEGLRRALGEHAYRIPVSAVKSMIGQSYAAGSLMGLAAGLMSMNLGVVPPTINLESPDPECDLDYVPLHARRNDVETALVLGMSFGGTHSASIIRKVT